MHYAKFNNKYADHKIPGVKKMCIYVILTQICYPLCNVSTIIFSSMLVSVVMTYVIVILFILILMKKWPISVSQSEQNIRKTLRYNCKTFSKNLSIQFCSLPW